MIDALWLVFRALIQGRSAVLRFHVKNQMVDTEFCHESGPIEFGRGPRRETERFVIKDITVSRDHLRVEELPGGNVRIENLSQRKPIPLANGGTIAIGASCELIPPLRLDVGDTTLEIEWSPEMDSVGSLQTVAVPFRTGPDTLPPVRLRDLGDSPAPEQVTNWLETVLGLQRFASESVELYDQAARALVDLVGLDCGMVLLRRGEQWDAAAQHAPSEGVTSSFSHTLLNYVVSEKRTFYQDLCDFQMVQSLQDIKAAVVSPIFGVEGEVAGALYGTRTRQVTDDANRITSLEAQVVQLLAAVVSANLARAVASRTRVQFEQFFSRELVRELEQNPDLLEGREQDVTILVSDLRGFSTLSEQLGARKTCQLVRDMMERLSERIIEYGGVIVDYAGDGILAMWNAPAQTPDHAERACRAALAMKGELPGLNSRWHAIVGGPLSLGIGINSGTAQVGNTGSLRKFKYGPHGNTVNLASRVQDATKRLGVPVLITASTHNELRERFATRRLCQARVAGIHDPVVLYELHCERAPHEWLEQRDAYETALSMYESGQAGRACQSLIRLLELGDQKKEYDGPTLKLLRKVWESLENGSHSVDKVLDLSHK